MFRRLLLYLLIVPWGIALPAQSPYKTTIFKPGSTFTATSQTGSAIPLGTAYSTGTITLTGTALTTATFGLQVSTDGGVTYSAAPLNLIATPGTIATTMTATASGLYSVNLANVTHVKFVTSGTFTATSITLLLTAAPNGSLARSSGGSSGGAPLPCGVAATNYPCLDAANRFTNANTFSLSGGAIDTPIIATSNGTTSTGYDICNTSGGGKCWHLWSLGNDYASTGQVGKFAMVVPDLSSSVYTLSATQITHNSATSLCWASGDPTLNPADTCLSRGSAGVVNVGTTQLAGQLSGTSGSIGGSLLAGAGTCATGTASVTGAVAGHTVGVSTSDGTSYNGLTSVSATVTSANTVTVSVCAIAAVTPAAKTYNVTTY